MILILISDQYVDSNSIVYEHPLNIMKRNNHNISYIVFLGTITSHYLIYIYILRYEETDTAACFCLHVNVIL